MCYAAARFLIITEIFLMFEFEPCHEKNLLFAYVKIKAEIGCRISADQCLCFCYIESAIPLREYNEKKAISNAYLIPPAE